ncbi:polysaccharide biosynthesis protein [Dokdonella sp. MW10]|uniref:polysaccharide biosynthesis protein n=1 Tax=Dokdonella sp. MW10 TaxID=2992926 RepID=UPI003F7E1A05
MTSPGNDNDLPDHVGAALGAAAGDIARRANASRSISRIVEPTPLMPARLEERRLIHREQSVREQADAFREVRTALLALGDGRNFITMVAPVSSGSGGSFVARNLAAAFAFDEAKTALLIDCDLRHPSLHRDLVVDAERGGLTDYLDHPALGVENILYHTGVPRLRLIPAGRQRETSGEYFTSFRMRAMLDSLRSRYADRYLFLDGPAVRNSPDAQILADLADYVVLVAGSGRDTPAAIQKAVARFDPNKLAGVVLNELP